MIDRETVVEQAWKQVPAYTGWTGSTMDTVNDQFSQTVTAYNPDCNLQPEETDPFGELASLLSNAQPGELLTLTETGTDSNLGFLSTGLASDSVTSIDSGLLTSGTGASNFITLNQNTAGIGISSSGSWHIRTNLYPKFWDELKDKYSTSFCPGIVSDDKIYWSRGKNCKVQVDTNVGPSADPHAIFRISIQVEYTNLYKEQFFNSMDAVCEFFDRKKPADILDSLERFEGKYQMAVDNLKTDFDIELL